MIKQILAEPLVHFLLIGGCLFAISYLAKSDASVKDNQIVVSAERIEQLRQVFEKVRQRPPTEEELRAAVEDFVLEEAYYRRAVAMGIDRDDTIIRRRLRQKLEFLTDDIASLVEPSQEQLEAFLAQNPERFRESTTLTFQQIYFNPQKHGPQPEKWISDQLAKLKDGASLAGDTTLLPERYDEIRAEQLNSQFGPGFAEQVEKMPPGKWSGPIRSGLGLHVVRLENATPGELPQLEQIRELVVREWSNQQRLVNRNKWNDELRDEFEITIEWPEPKEVVPDP